MRESVRHAAPLRVCLATALTAVACAHPPVAAQTPADILVEFREALARDDATHAYALLSPAQKARLSYADFQHKLAQNPDEAAALTRALSQPGTARVSAQVPLASPFGTLELVQVADGSFRIESPIVDFYPSGTPADALSSFVRALEAGRWDVVLSLMPASDRVGLDAETLGTRLAERREGLTRLAALLKSASNAPIEIVGQRATMTYGESYTARLLRESDGWKIEDPE